MNTKQKHKIQNHKDSELSSKARKIKKTYKFGEMFVDVVFNSLQSKLEFEDEVFHYGSYPEHNTPKKHRKTKKQRKNRKSRSYSKQVEKWKKQKTNGVLK